MIIGVSMASVAGQMIPLTQIDPKYYDLRPQAAQTGLLLVPAVFALSLIAYGHKAVKWQLTNTLLVLQIILLIPLYQFGPVWELGCAIAGTLVMLYRESSTIHLSYHIALIAFSFSLVVANINRHLTHAFMGELGCQTVSAICLVANSLILCYLQPSSEFYSNLTFGWLQKTLDRDIVTQDSLEKTPDALITENAFSDFKSFQRKYPEGTSFSTLIQKRYAWWYIKASTFFLGEVLFPFAQPLLLKSLIVQVTSYDEKQNSKYMSRAFTLILALAGIDFLATLAATKFRRQVTTMALHMMVGLGAFIQDKIFRLETMPESSGDIINHFATDITNVLHVPYYFDQLWKAPLQLIVCTFFLYQLLSYAVFWGLLVLAICGPVSYFLAKTQSMVYRKMQSQRSARYSLVGQMLKNIKTLKFYTLEKHTFDTIRDIRSREINTLKRVNQIKLFDTFLWHTCIFLCSFVSLYMFREQHGGKLTLDVVFPTMVLFQILQQPFKVLPTNVSLLVESVVSLKRVSGFLDHPEDGVDRESLNLEETSQQIIDDLNNNVDLISIIGKVGSGKSTLLDMIVQKSPQAVAYMTQGHFLLNASIKDNIIFGSNLDEERYKTVLYQCALVPDLANLSHGDQTLIGDKGLSLSGGQQARISMARALYSGYTMCLDDPLAALDQHVQNHVIRHALAYAESQMVMATNSHKLLDYGRVYNLDTRGQAAIAAKKNLEDLREPNVVPQDINVQPPASLQQEEITTSGRVNWSVYRRYFQEFGFFTFTVFMIFAIGFAGLGVAAGLAISRANVFYYLMFGLVAGLSEIISNLIFLKGSCSVGLKMHYRLLTCVITSPLAFFVSTPMGRVLNRLTADLKLTDEEVANNGRLFVYSCIEAAFGLGLIVAAAPLSIIFVAGLLMLYKHYEAIYVKTSRELKRIVAATSSPILTILGESIDGRHVISAYSRQPYMSGRLCEALDENNKARFIQGNLGYWLGLRLKGIGCGIIFVAGVLSLFALGSGQLSVALLSLTMTYALGITKHLDAIVSSLIMVETNSVSVERIVEWMGNEKQDPLDTDVEANGSSGIPYPSEIDLLSDKPPQKIFTKGHVQIEGWNVFYGDTQVLKNINLDIPGGTKLAIVGRTGSGKSTLVNSLFRLVEPRTGEVDIDGYNIAKVPLLDLRANMAIIPQDCQVFAGTVRLNLDPHDIHTDEELVSALRSCSLDFALDMHLSEDGSNISTGQQQLLCLGRAVLKKAAVVCLDEATSSVDKDTEKVVGSVLQNAFANSTVITIAHRLETVIDSDKICVLDKGEVVEYGSPSELLAKKGLFYELHKSNRLD
jgi:ATP-binding cassette subfamily C (CFTR/MRP) protein 1